jgi:hypothetical protein
VEIDYKAKFELKNSKIFCNYCKKTIANIKKMCYNNNMYFFSRFF